MTNPYNVSVESSKETERRFVVEAKVRNERGEVLYVRSRWKNTETPTYSIGKSDHTSPIVHLFANDLENYAKLIAACLGEVSETLVKEL